MYVRERERVYVREKRVYVIGRESVFVKVRENCVCGYVYLYCVLKTIEVRVTVCVAVL